MSRASEILATTYAVRHCTVHGCRKCIARARWNRRKKMAIPEKPDPPRDRKEVMRP